MHATDHHLTWSIDEFLIETSTTLPYASKNRFRVSSVKRPSILCCNCDMVNLDSHALVVAMTSKRAYLECVVTNMDGVDHVVV